MRLILSCLDKPAIWGGIVGAWLLVPLILSTCYEVFARYLFGAPTIWAFELSGMLMGANFLLAAAYALLTSSHIRVEMFYDRFGPRTQAAIEIIGYACFTLPMLAWLAWALGDWVAVTIKSKEGTGASAWNPPAWPMRAILWVSFVLLALQVVAEILRNVRKLMAGKAAEPAA